MRVALKMGLALVAVIAAASAQAKTTAADVIAQLEKSFAAVKDYRVEAEVSVKSPQITVDKTTATIYFKRPDKLKVAARDGFALIPEQAIPGDPAKWIRENFTATYAGSGNLDGQSAHVLKLEPKPTSTFEPMTIWVEKKRGLLIGTELNSGDAQMKSKWTYKRVDGKYWMPSQITIEMSGMAGQVVYDPHKGKVAPPKSAKGTAVVKFSNYRVNKGISDRVFMDNR